MIAHLKGQVVDISEDALTVDVNGVGYELFCSMNTLTHVALGEPTGLFVHTHAREDALHLFGFGTRLEKQIFLSLNKVNGVGPKMAMKILSGAQLSALVEMIEAGDVKALSQLPKVGKKTAEQIILTLKGKLVLASEAPMSSKRALTQRDQVMSALTNLGFRLNDIEPVLETLPTDVDVEDGVRRALAALTQI